MVSFKVDPAFVFTAKSVQVARCLHLKCKRPDSFQFHLPPEILEKMKIIYEEEEVPIFLDAKAKKLLTEAKEFFEKFDLNFSKLSGNCLCKMH